MPLARLSSRFPKVFGPHHRMEELRLSAHLTIYRVKGDFAPRYRCRTIPIVTSSLGQRVNQRLKALGHLGISVNKVLQTSSFIIASSASSSCLKSGLIPQRWAFTQDRGEGVNSVYLRLNKKALHSAVGFKGKS